MSEPTAHHASPMGPQGRITRLDRLAGVRGMLLGWSLWLLGSWAVALMISGPTPGARWMIFAALIGFMLIWPAVRLSQITDTSEAATRLGDVWSIGFEWLCLNLVFQAVVWPLHLIADWRMDQTWWIALAVATWSLLIGFVIAIGRQLADHLARALAMGICVAVLFGEPLLIGLAKQGRGPQAGWPMRLCPIQVLWAFTGEGATFDPRPWYETILGIGLAAVVGWVGLSLWIGFASRHDQ